MVGNLVELKGHHIAVEALTRLPDVELLCVGSGPERERLQALATRLGVLDRVRFVGQVPQDDLPWWYSAADVLALCSSREGWPNVLLEAMACGTPVMSTAVSGTPDIVTDPSAGLLMEDRDTRSFIRAWQALQMAAPSRDATREHARRFSWEATTQGQLELFRSLR
jgi:teichuronic acid biosynthesis glycosyltransferase TuaC